MRGTLQAVTVAAGLGLLALGPALSAQEIAVDARVDPTLVGVGQLVTLTVEARIEGGIGLDLDPGFELQNLEILAGPSQSQQVSFVNGRVSRSQTLSWSLQATQAGTARVTELVLTVNDERFELPEQVIEVQEEPVDRVSPPGSRRRLTDPFEDFFEPSWRRRSTAVPDPKLFLRAEVSTTEPYVGQQVLYSLLLFTQADVGSVSPQSMPEFEGMWSVDIEQPNKPKSVMTEIQGERYGRVVLLQRALFPLRSGPVRLDPVEARLIARIPERSWMGAFGTYDKEYELSSNAVNLEVRPLPTAPPGFQGAVGDLELEIDLQPREIELGDAATLSLTLSGKGHVSSLPAPSLPALENVRVFPPQKSGWDRAVGTTVQGEKTWSYVLVPERAGVWEIPIESYSFFSPTTASFEETSAETLVLVARPSPEEEAGVTAPGDPPDASEDDTTAAPTGEPASTSPPLRWLAVVGILLLLASLLPLGKRYVGRLQATAHLRRHLKSAATIDKPRAAAEAIERAWREFLLERWDLPESTSAGNWADALRERGLGDSAASEVSRLADDLHYLRYAPELSDYQSIRVDVLERSRQLARILG